MSGDPLANIAATDPGEDFEEMCWGLLRRRYPIPDLVRLPATLGGDHGIEGFSKDGIAYQCYATATHCLSAIARTSRSRS